MGCTKTSRLIALGLSLFILGVVVIALVIVLKDDDDNGDEKEKIFDPYTNATFQAINTNTCGRIQGRKENITKDDGSKTLIYEFRNIPYAVPPVGDRRWKPSKLLTKGHKNCWSNVLTYSDKDVICSQRRRGVATITGEEDCLALDVRTPSVEMNANLPVMVWIHGGAMLWSNKQAEGYHPDNEYTASLNAVVVNINYRLNIFGFLSLQELWIEAGEDKSYANYGITDMVTALKWVKENIKSFGGNPNDVTVFGDSGGATGVNALLTSELPRGLFHRAIVSSGIPAIQMNHEQANGLYRSYLIGLNCTRNTASETRQCLESLSVDKLLNIAPWFVESVPGVNPILTNIIQYQVFPPANKRLVGYPVEVLDPVVIKNSPNKITSSGTTQKIDILLINVAEEVLALLNVSTMGQLEAVLRPNVETYGDATYEELLGLYTGSNATNNYPPNIETSRYLYSVIGSDWYGGVCVTNDWVNDLSALQDYNAYRVMLSQQPQEITFQRTRGAFHGWLTTALFDFKEHNYTPGPDDQYLKANLRKLFKEFIMGKFQTYKDKTVVLWNNTINTMANNYHSKQCEYLKRNGFLNVGAGALGPDTSFDPYTNATFQAINTNTCGRIQGRKENITKDDGNNTLIYEFRNIPYAVPPVGERRWKPSQLLTKGHKNCWSNVLTYSDKDVICSQRRRGVATITGEEDCLALDVRTPSVEMNANLPVMVWIHGGAMLWSHKQVIGYHPDNEYTASLNAVVVNINYRLNIFGFLSLNELWIEAGEDKSYANYGITDMVTALKWVKENIQSFGGNPNDVTLFGDSGGATGVNALLASELPRGLFHRAISSSGIPAIQMNHEQANALYRNYLIGLNCTSNTASETRKCLESLSVDKLLNIAPWFVETVPGVNPILTNIIQYQVFPPANRRLLGFPVEVIDPVVIKQSPNKITSSGTNQKIDVLLINVAEEIPAFLNVSTMQQLEAVLKPNVETYGNATYEELLGLYTGSNATNNYPPNIETSRYLYSVISSDWYSGVCVVNDWVNDLSALQDYNAYRVMLSQQPQEITFQLTRGAFHGWLTTALFDFKEHNYTPGPDDQYLKANLRKLFKEFIMGKFQTYKDKTVVLWNNTINTMANSYHSKQCDYLKTNGFLNVGAGALGP